MLKTWNLGLFLCKSDKLILSLKTLPRWKNDSFCSVIANQDKLKRPWATRKIFVYFPCKISWKKYPLKSTNFCFCDALHEHNWTDCQVLSFQSVLVILFSIAMITDAEIFGKKGFILMLEKRIVPGWWDREAHKITYFIISQLFEYSFEVVGKEEDTVRNPLLSLDYQIFQEEETKLFN